MRCSRASRAVFVSDPFRVNWGKAGAGDWNVFVLQKLVAPRLRAVAPWWQWSSQTVLTGPATLHPEQVYPLLGWPIADESWARLYDLTADALPAALTARLEQVFGGALVVGFEMPPVLRAWLSKEGLPWINLAVHPVRFLPDLLWSVSTNDDGMQEALAAFAFATKRIEQEVSKRRRRAPRVLAPAGAAIVIGQVGHDRSRIAKGRFWTAEDFAAEIDRWSAGRRLCVKPHPLGKDDSADEAWLRARGAQVVDDNVYDLLAADGDHIFAALSSSVLTEAKWFGREALRLMPAMEPVEPEVTVGGAIFERAFWARVLKPVSARPCRPWPRLPWLVRSDASRRLIKRNWGWTPEGSRS